MSGKPERAETLLQFFHFDKDEKQVQSRIEAFIGDGLNEAVRLAVGAVSVLSPDLLAAGFAKGLHLVLDTPLKDVLIGGWKAWNELAQYHDRAKFPPAETFYCKPHKHTVVGYEYKPGLQLVANGKRVPKAILSFEISAQLINAPLLEIRDARIMSAKLPHFEGEGVVKCQGKTLLERALGEITLDGEFVFRDGITIPGRPHDGR